jgi:hypothetical protein
LTLPQWQPKLGSVEWQNQRSRQIRSHHRRDSPRHGVFGWWRDADRGDIDRVQHAPANGAIAKGD